MTESGTVFGIIAIALVFMLSFGVYIAAIASDPTCANNVPSKLQCGTGGTINIATGSSTGSVAITFSTPFSVVPKEITVTPRTISAVTVTFPVYTATFLATTSTGQTWTNMPAIKTEIFGDTTHETAVVGSGAPFISATIASFSVDCPSGSGSNSATAVLRPEYSLDSGATWNSVASVATGLDFNINVSCVLSSTIQSTIASGLQAATATNVAFRVVGLNGGGVGDVPVFTQIQLVFFIQEKYYPSFTVTTKTTTNFSVQATYPFQNQAGSISDTFDWGAHA